MHDGVRPKKDGSASSSTDLVVQHNTTQHQNAIIMSLHAPKLRSYERGLIGMVLVPTGKRGWQAGGGLLQDRATQPLWESWPSCYS